VVAACVCYPMIQVIKSKLEIDDSLDVFAVHGVGGMTGSLLLAFFMSPSLGGTGGADYSIIGQLGGQAVGVGVVAIWSALASVILALGVSWIMPMRVGEDAEREGLDIASHGERGWEMD
jgi:Amt family ammonium transporter